MQPAPYIVPPDRYEAATFVLRSYQPGDGECVADAKNSSYEHLRTFMAWATPHQSVERAEQYCREVRARWLLATDFAIGIWEPGEARLLGG